MPLLNDLKIFNRLFSTSAIRLQKRMPPKKAAAPEKKVLLGRPSNNLKVGIVGMYSIDI